MKKMNFGRNVQIASESYFTPKTEAEVLALLNQNKGRSIHCMGRLHSWIRVLDRPTTARSMTLLDLRNFDSVRLNRGIAMTVDVRAGRQIKRLFPEPECYLLQSMMKNSSAIKVCRTPGSEPNAIRESRTVR